MENNDDQGSVDLEAEFDALVDGRDYTPPDKEESDEKVDESDDVVDDESEKDEEEVDDEESDESAEEDDSSEEDEGEPEEGDEESEESGNEDEESDGDDEDSELASRVKELEKADAEAQAEKARLNNEVASYVDYNDFTSDDALLDMEELPDIEVGSGEDKTTLKEFVKEYPAMMDVFNILLGSTAKKVAASMVSPLLKEVDQLNFRNSLEDIAPGTYSKVSSEGFRSWLSKQSKGVQRLAQSPDLKDSKLVIDLYSKDSESKTEVSKPKSKKAAAPVKKKKASEKKKKMDKLLGDNLKSKPESSDSDGSESLEEEWERITSNGK